MLLDVFWRSFSGIFVFCDRALPASCPSPAPLPYGCATAKVDLRAVQWRVERVKGNRSPPMLFGRFHTILHLFSAD